MPIEIERKFLVSGEFRPDVYESVHIVQGYLCSSAGKTVRVRTWGEKGFLTIKGPTAKDSCSRFEWEIEIPLKDALELIKLCDGGVIDKVRHLVSFNGHLFEVDEFSGENQGLVVAEVELASEDEDFEKPDWLGPEVTGDRRYYNSRLLANPYVTWNQD